MVLVGTTALILINLQTAPLQSNCPEMEVHANWKSGILDKNINAHPAYSQGAAFVLLLVLALLLASFLLILNAVKVTLLMIDRFI